MNEWQPIETAPKILEQRILINNTLVTVTAYWNGEKWVNERNKKGDMTGIKYWKPLPQPPKEL